MGEFFPLLYFPEDYFPEGYFGEMTGTGTTYADAALTADGTGGAVLAARGDAGAALTVAGFGTASLAPMVPDVQLPTTPVGGASAGFGRVWAQAERRRFVDAALAVAGVGGAVFTARGDSRVAVAAFGQGHAAFGAEVVAVAVKQVAVKRDHELELWLLAA